jgi:hypothetical protein
MDLPLVMVFLSTTISITEKGLFVLILYTLRKPYSFPFSSFIPQPSSFIIPLCPYLPPTT